MRDPENREEWQEAADLAETFLLIDSAIKYGLITGGPQADLDRCARILKLAKIIDVHPDKKRVHEYIKAMAKGGEGEHLGSIQTKG